LRQALHGTEILGREVSRCTHADNPAGPAALVSSDFPEGIMWRPPA
jgi:hypothetical protein